MGMAASQAKMAVLATRKADQELEMNYLTRVQTFLAAASFQWTGLTASLQRALQIDEANPPDTSDKRHEVMARIAKLQATDDMFAKQCRKIEEEQEAVHKELGEIQKNLAANISTSFQLMDGPTQDPPRLNHRSYRQRHSDGSSNNPSPPSPIEIHQQYSVDPPEATQLTQPSESLPLWRCVCWHIWFCVLSTTTGSCAFGIVWSAIYRSVSDAFTVASYLLAAGTLLSGVLMFKHNDACVQRALRKRRESQNEGSCRLTLIGRSR